MPISGSVSQWIKDVKAGDPGAAANLWQRFHHNLLRIARRRLQGVSRRVEDEDDLVTNAFASFFQRARDGQFPDLTTRAELWALLVTITDRKAVNNVRRHLSIKRGGGRIRGDSTFGSGDHRDHGLASWAGEGDPPPDVLVALAEWIELLDDDLRQIVRLKVAGYTNEEISQRVDRSLATIERRLRLLRDDWTKELLG